MPTVEIQWHGDAESAREFVTELPALLAGRAPDPTGIAEGILLGMGMALLGEVQRDFITKARGGVGRDGIKWEPLKEETVRRRRKGKGKATHAGDVEILRDTGELFRSLTPGINPPGQIADISPGLVKVGTDKKPWHQHGNDNLPARPLWPQDGSIPEAWLPALWQSLADGIVAVARFWAGRGGPP